MLQIQQQDTKTQVDTNYSCHHLTTSERRLVNVSPVCKPMPTYSPKHPPSRNGNTHLSPGGPLLTFTYLNSIWLQQQRFTVNLRSWHQSYANFESGIVILHLPTGLCKPHLSRFYCVFLLLYRSVWHCLSDTIWRSYISFYIQYIKSCVLHLCM